MLRLKSFYRKLFCAGISHNLFFQENKDMSAGDQYEQYFVVENEQRVFYKAKATSLPAIFLGFWGLRTIIWGKELRKLG